MKNHSLTLNDDGEVFQSFCMDVAAAAGENLSTRHLILEQTQTFWRDKLNKIFFYVNNISCEREEVSSWISSAKKSTFLLALKYNHCALLKNSEKLFFHSSIKPHLRRAIKVRKIVLSSTHIRFGWSSIISYEFRMAFALSVRVTSSRSPAIHAICDLDEGSKQVQHKSTSISYIWRRKNHRFLSVKLRSSWVY